MNLSFSKPRAGCRAATAIQLLIAFIVTAGSAFAQCSGYGSSAIVDVNRAKVPTTQINYTVLVSGAWSFLADTSHGGSVTNSNGYDICFSDAGNTSRYNWEIESYDNTTGAASFWVLAPTVNGAASSSDTLFKIWYGNSSVTTFQGGAAGSNWDSNYQAVYHLPNGTALSAADSSANGNNGSLVNGPTAGAGQVGGAATFAAGSSQYIDLGNSATIGIAGPVTVEAWIKYTGSFTAGQFPRIISNLTGSNYNGFELLLHDPSGGDGNKVYFQVGAAGSINTVLASTPLVAGNVYHMVGTYDGSSAKIFANGVQQAGVVWGANRIGASSQNVNIGDWPAIRGSAYWNGWIDEVRISNIARSADWVAAEYNNINSPGTFATIVSGLPPTISSFTATPAATAAGQASTLAWVTTGATSVSISPGTFTSTNSNGSTTVNPVSTTTYTLTASNSAGSVQAQATVTVTAAPPPTDTGMSCSANSPSSILCQWATNTPATSQVRCGTQPGGPYSYATTVLHPVQVGTSTWWGVTSHSIALTGLPNNTGPMAYYCVALSTNVNGATATSAEVTSGTTAPLVSTPVTVASYSPVTRYNDQANGRQGLPARGIWHDGDTRLCTWAYDDKTYCVCNDCFGVNRAYSNNIGLGWWTNDQMTATQIGGQLPTGPEGGLNYPAGYTDNSRAGTEGIVSVRGWLYWFTNRFGSVSSAWASVMMKSNDGFQTSIGPAHNTGPGAVPVAGIDYPPQGTYSLPAGNSVLAWPVQQCQDWSINCTWTANTDGFVYFGMPDNAGLNWYLGRVRIEDLPLMDYTKFTYYTGTQTGDDGLYDSNWSSNRSAATLFSYAAYGRKPQIAFIPDFNRYVMTSWAYPADSPDQGGAILIWDLGSYPWGAPQLITSIPRDNSHVNYFPVFPQLAIVTYKKVSSSPLKATIRLSTTGSYSAKSGDPDTDEYSPHYRDLTLVQSARTEPRSLISSAGRRSHLATGLDLFYNFQGLSWSTVIPDLSPGGKFSIPAASPANPIYDAYGLINFGLPNNSNDGVWYGQQNYRLATPFTGALETGASTIFACFGHYPGTAIQPAMSGEIVLNKSGDFEILRNGATASWNIVFKGTTLGAVNIADGAIGCVVVRRDTGNNVTVYGSSGIRQGMPLTPSLGPVNVPGTWGPSPLVLGDSTNSLFGVLSELLIYSRALSDAELVREMEAIRSELNSRGVTPPIARAIGVSPNAPGGLDNVSFRI